MIRSRRSRRSASATVIVGVALGLVAASGSASTAQLIDVVLPPECKYVPPGSVCPPGSATALVYQAEPGEANLVSVTGSTQEVRISDAAALIQPGRGCTRIDRHKVSCSLPGLSGVFVDTGGGADTVRSGYGGVMVNGGPGDDVLVGGPFGDELYGGRGADVLRGRGGDDRLYDASPRHPLGSGDLAPFFRFDESPFDPAVVPLASPGRGRDSFDGGRGDDTISYESRLAGVRVDLANTAAVGGARGEYDSVRGVDQALGGAGDDRLAGNNRRTNWLGGAEGDDRIVGRRGADHIEGGSGRNVIMAGPGNDVINSPYKPSDYGPERIFCGSGTDSVSWIFPSDFLNDDCERLEFNFLRDGGLFGGGVASLLPLRKGATPTVLSATELWCYAVLNPSGCQLRLELRVDGPAARRGTAPPRGTLLGSGSYTFSADERKGVSLGVSPEGVETLRRHRALRVRVSVAEGSPHQPGGYLTVLRTP